MKTVSVETAEEPCPLLAALLRWPVSRGGADGSIVFVVGVLIPPSCRGVDRWPALPELVNPDVFPQISRIDPQPAPQGPTPPGPQGPPGPSRVRKVTSRRAPSCEAEPTDQQVTDMPPDMARSTSGDMEFTMGFERDSKLND